jgi:tetratricopeptide (TPR) repeat protein
VAIVTATVFAVLSLRKYPYIAVGWLWYLGTLIPEIGLVQAGSQSRADRYTYLSLIGILIIVAWGAVELFEKRGWNQRVVGGVAAGLCIGWTFLAYSNVKYWRNSTALFAHAVEVTPANYIAYNNLGDALRQDGKIEEAAESFAHVVAIMPEDADGQDNLGEALTEEGRIGEAVSHLREAVRLRPGFAKVHLDLGAALLRGGQAGEAEAQYRAAIQLDPKNAAAQYGLGGVLLAQRHGEEARVYFERALPLLIAEVEMNPEGVDGLYNLGALYSALGRTDDAIGAFRQVVVLRPNDAQAHFNLATLLVSRGRYDDAILECLETLRVDPGHPGAGRLMEQIRSRQQKQLGRE